MMLHGCVNKKTSPNAHTHTRTFTATQEQLQLGPTAQPTSRAVPTTSTGMGRNGGKQLRKWIQTM